MSFLTAFLIRQFLRHLVFFCMSLSHTVLDLKRHLIRWLKELDYLDTEVELPRHMQYAKFWMIYFKGKKLSCGIEMNQGIYQYVLPSSMLWRAYLKIHAVGAKWSENMEESAANRRTFDIPWEGTKLFCVLEC